MRYRAARSLLLVLGCVLVVPLVPSSHAKAASGFIERPRPPRPTRLILPPIRPPRAALLQTRRGYTATKLVDGRVLVVGGIDADGMLASAELYDPRTGVFVSVEELAEPRAYHTALLLADGRVLVLGGVGEDGAPIESAEIFDPETETWAFVAEVGR